MKLVSWTDENGWMHRSLLRDIDHDPSRGILQDPPDINQLDWESIKRTLHNQLVARDIFTASDLNKPQAQQAIPGAVLAALRKPLIELYRRGGPSNHTGGQ